MNTVKSWIGSSCVICLISNGILHAAGNNDVHQDRITGDRSSLITPYQPVTFQRVVQVPLKLKMSYHLRYGTTNDYQKAVKKSQLAANQGLGHDPYNLKMSYVSGGAVTTDYQQALNGSKLSVIQAGGYKLGEMYLNGDILTQGPQ
jgi:hypothetical protein